MTTMNPEPFDPLQLAGNPATPRDTLTRLAQDEDAAVRERVGLNPNAPAEALVILAENRVDDPFAELPAEPQTPPPDYPRANFEPPF